MHFSKILLTGGNGSVGAELYDQLKFKHQIPVIKLEKANHVSSLKTVLQQGESTLLLHCGASSSRVSKYKELKANNIMSCLQLSNLINKYKNLRIIFFSAVSIFKSTKIIEQQSEPKPCDMYSFSKLIGEFFFEACEYPSRVLILRLPGIYGTSCDKGFLTSLISTAQENKLITITNSNGHFNSAISIDSLSNFLASLCSEEFFDNAVNFSPIFLGFEPKIMFNEMATNIKEKFGGTIKLKKGNNNFLVTLEPAKLAGFKPENFDSILSVINRPIRIPNSAGW